MRTTCPVLLFSLAIATAVSADTLTQWNFNSNPPDSTSNTGTNVPSVGTGTISVIGTVIQNVSATQQYSLATGSSDPASADDSACHTRNYPLQGESNKTSGIEVRVSTVGYESIVVSWDQQNSPAASKYLRFQYSVDGATFVDYTVSTMNMSNTFVNGRTVNLTPILAANDNANFAFRLVSEFQSTATGSGDPAYVATGAASYSPNGTMRFDMLTVSGSPPDGNSFPTISSIPDQTIRVDNVTDTLPFQVGDLETPADQLIVHAISSNPGLASDAAILIEGVGANRTVTVQPNFDQTGTVTITLWVVDGGAKSNSTSFVLTVLPNNTPPSLSTLTNVHTVKNTSFEPVNLMVSDAEEDAASLAVSASSSDQTVIPDANLVVGGAVVSRSLTITPAPDQVGNSVITVTVTDNGGLTATRSFNAMVVPSGNILLREPFDYADGPVTINSGRLWATRAGTPAEIQVVSGTALLTGRQSEDVVARLIGGPYGTNGSTVLYASFDVTFSVLPGIAPEVFAHFFGINANDFLGRVLASTTNAGPGFFRLGVANATSAASNVVDYPLDLSLDTPYQVVVAYDVAGGGSKLWVNPTSGGSPVEAIDAREPKPVNAYGLRQARDTQRLRDIGTMRIDNLLVGLSFDDVTPNLTRVRIRRAGNAVKVSWPSGGVWEGFVLEGTPTLENPDWQPVNQATVSINGWDVVTIENPDPGENRFFRLRKSF